jgi:hypothetical protein
MQAHEAAVVLAVAATYDQRLRPPTEADAAARAAAWAEALAGDMPPDWARQAVVAHYSGSRDVVMPADLNGAWARERAARKALAAEQAQRLAIEQQRANAVPMPAEVRALIARVADRMAVPSD